MEPEVRPMQSEAPAPAPDSCFQLPPRTEERPAGAAPWGWLGHAQEAGSWVGTWWVCGPWWSVGILLPSVSPRGGILWRLNLA